MRLRQETTVAIIFFLTYVKKKETKEHILLRVRICVYTCVRMRVDICSRTSVTRLRVHAWPAVSRLSSYSLSSFVSRKRVRTYRQHTRNAHTRHTHIRARDLQYFCVARAITRKTIRPPIRSTAYKYTPLELLARVSPNYVTIPVYHVVQLLIIRISFSSLSYFNFLLVFLMQNTFEFLR